MRLIYSLFALLILSAMPIASQAQMIEIPQKVNTPRPYSPMCQTTQTIGLTQITVHYSRPRVTDERYGRKLDRSGNIWGNLVPYSTPENPNVWRAGANENTIIAFSDDVKIEGHDIAKGMYGLHMLIYEGDSATIIFSKSHTSWGSFSYRQSEDVLRVNVKMKEAHYAESLTYDFINISTKTAEVALHWERKRIPFEVEVDVDSVVMENFRQELRSSAGFDWRGWYGAANYAFQNGIYTEEALDWASQSVRMEKRFENMQLLGQLQEAMGMEKEAKNTIEEALSDARGIELYSYASDLNAQGKKERAEEITKLNYKKHPKDWVANLGMAEMNEGKKELLEALKFYQKSLADAPKPNQSQILVHIGRVQKKIKKEKEKKK